MLCPLKNLWDLRCRCGCPCFRRFWDQETGNRGPNIVPSVTGSSFSGPQNKGTPQPLDPEIYTNRNTINPRLDSEPQTRNWQARTHSPFRPFAPQRDSRNSSIVAASPAPAEASQHPRRGCLEPPSRHPPETSSLSLMD